MIDTHCHLDAREFDTDRDAVVAAAREAGVTTLILPSVEVSGFPAVRACCQRYPGCHPAYGIHPLYVGAAREDDLYTLRQWLRDEISGEHPPVAVGEIGLDFFVPGHDASRQEQFFIEQLQIAAEFNLPVLLHVRRAVVQVLKCLRHSKVRRGIAHAFNGSRQQAQAFIDLGFKLGFGGAMTWPRATRIRQLATELPLESIVLETDAPDMSPVWRQGQRNSPDQLPLIAATLADLTRLPPGRILEQTNANALAVIESLSGGLSE
ncbi:MAG: TatD family hydrolase [Propionivibrio sp.]|nr:TatD family hydrolase [Propionivibrio sp.]